MVLNRGYMYPLGVPITETGVRSTNIFRHTRPENSCDVLSIVASAVNFVRVQTLNHGLFTVFCNDVQAQHNVLRDYTKVPLLFCVRVLIRVLELHKEIEQFLRRGGSGIAEHLENEFITSLA